MNWCRAQFIEGQITYSLWLDNGKLYITVVVIVIGTDFILKEKIPTFA